MAQRQRRGTHVDQGCIESKNLNVPDVLGGGKGAANSARNQRDHVLGISPITKSSRAAAETKPKGT